MRVEDIINGIRIEWIDDAGVTQDDLILLSELGQMLKLRGISEWCSFRMEHWLRSYEVVWSDGQWFMEN